MRKPLTICAALLCAGSSALLWRLWTDSAPRFESHHTNRTSQHAPGLPPGGESRALTSPQSVRVAQATPTGKLTVADIAETAMQLNAPANTVADDLEILQSLLDFYRRANSGSGPEGGLNEEILTDLRGENGMRLAVFPERHPSLNSAGQLLDRWGTPYYFHPVSRASIEIRSAGPDRKLWTDDDVSSGAPSEKDAQLAGVAADQ